MKRKVDQGMTFAEMMAAKQKAPATKPAMTKAQERAAFAQAVEEAKRKARLDEQEAIRAECMARDAQELAKAEQALPDANTFSAEPPPMLQPRREMAKDVRAKVKAIAQHLAPDFEVWLIQLGRESPYQAVMAYLAMLEYHVPKLSRQEVKADVSHRGLVGVLSTLGDAGQSAVGAPGYPALETDWTGEMGPGSTRCRTH